MAKQFSIWRMELLHPAMWHDHDIDFARWLHSAMWHVALESWQWIHRVAAPCNVIRGFGMTCHVIRVNVRHIGILHLVSVLTISSQNDMSFCTSLRNFILTDHLQQKKMTSYRFSRWRIWAILDFRGPIMGSLKSPYTGPSFASAGPLTPAGLQAPPRTALPLPSPSLSFSPSPLFP